MKQYKCTSDLILELPRGMVRCFTAYNYYRTIDTDRNNGILFIDDENDEHFIIDEDIEFYFEPKFIYGK